MYFCFLQPCLIAKCASPALDDQTRDNQHCLLGQRIILLTWPFLVAYIGYWINYCTYQYSCCIYKTWMGINIGLISSKKIGYWYCCSLFFAQKTPFRPLPGGTEKPSLAARRTAWLVSGRLDAAKLPAQRRNSMRTWRLNHWDWLACINHLTLNLI